VFRLTMEESISRSPPIARDAIGDDAWNWRDDDWSSYLRVKNRVAQALSCYGEVPDEMLEESKEPSEEDLRIADLAAVTPAARGGGSFEDSDDESADGTADTLEARARLFTPACRALPKVELHAHLNGCVRDQTLLELAREHRGDAPEGGPSTTLASLRETLGSSQDSGDVSASDAPRPLKKCFELFKTIHALCTDHATITRVAAEAVVDFALDGVVYLELRTTPKDFPERGVTKESYCEAALRGMALGAHVARRLLRRERGKGLQSSSRETTSFSEDESEKDVAFVARLILSVDRKESVAEAKRTVRLAAYLRDTDCGVVGVDLSGDPSVGSFAKLEPALKLARKNGLPVTLHCGEVVRRGEEAAMLRFKPERFGHCVATTRDEALWAQLRASKIPIELCITSNVVTDSVEKETREVNETPTREGTGGVSDADGAGNKNGDVKMSAASAAARHHLAKVHRAGHPFTIATDDPGVFDTTLSREYALAAASCGLRSEDLRQIARNSFEYAFVHAHEAMNEDDEELAKGDIDLVRAYLERETRAWPGLPAVTAADAIRESATKATSLTKRRIAGATREVTRRVNLFKDIANDLADVVAETENDDVSAFSQSRRGDEKVGARETQRDTPLFDRSERSSNTHAPEGSSDVSLSETTDGVERGVSNDSENSVSKWSKVRAVVSGAEDAEGASSPNSESASSSRFSKRGAVLNLVRGLSKPGSGDRADLAAQTFVTQTLLPLLNPSAGDLRDDARAAKRVLIELGVLDESAADKRETSAPSSAYEALVREAEDTDPSNRKNETETETENENENDALAALRRVGRARVRRAARLRRRRARRRFFLQTRAKIVRALRENGPVYALVLCSLFGNWPFSRLSDGSGDGDPRAMTALAPRLATRHAAALARSLKASVAFFADGAGGTLPTYDSARTLIATHVACVGVSARASWSFVRTGARGVFPTPETLANLLAKHARLASCAARRVLVGAFGSWSSSEPTRELAFSNGNGAAHRTSGTSGTTGTSGTSGTTGTSKQRRVFVVPKHTESVNGETRSLLTGASASSNSFGDEEAASGGARNAHRGSSGETSDRFLNRGPRRPRHVELVASSPDPSPGSGDLLRWDRETPEQE